MGDPESRRDFPERAQRAAFCHSQWRRRHKIWEAGAGTVTVPFSADIKRIRSAEFKARATADDRYWARWIRRAAGFENQLRIIMRKHFAVEFAEIAKAIRKSKLIRKPRKGADIRAQEFRAADLDVVVSRTLKRTGDRLTAQLEVFGLGVATKAAKWKAAELGFDWPGFTTSAESYLANYAPPLVDQLSTTTLNDLGRIIRKSIEEGVPEREVLDRINARYNRWVRSRPQVIARTEVGKLTSLAEQDTTEQIARQLTPDREMWKIWLTARDGRVRDSHVRLDGQKRKLDERFSNGLMFPRDPAGPVGEIANCIADPDAVIATVKGPKRIADIKPGDAVLSHQGVYRRVNRTASREAGDLVEVEVFHRKLRLTGNHRLLTDSGWKEVGRFTGEEMLVLAMSGTGRVIRFSYERRALKLADVGIDVLGTSSSWKAGYNLRLSTLDDEIRKCGFAGGRSVGGSGLKSLHFHPPVDSSGFLHPLQRFKVSVGCKEFWCNLRYGSTSSDGRRDRSSPINDAGEVSFVGFFHAPILHVTQIQGTAMVYNFSVEGDESYLVNGIVSHNCRCVLKHKIERVSLKKPRPVEPSEIG